MGAANPLPPLTPFDPATMIQSLDERGRGLRVAFFRPQAAADRWGHVVATVEQKLDGERIEPQLLSDERTSSDGWPLSPPLQSLAIEQRPSGAVALLVGMSGQSHWSASFEAIAGSRRVVIDIACRLASGVTQPRLGSLYVARHTWETLDLQFGPEMAVKPSSGGIYLEVQTMSHQPVRWKYTLELPDLTTTL